MKKKLIILFILVLTRSLFADEKILNEFISKINKENTWIPIEYLDVIKSKNRDTLKSIFPDYNYEKEWDELYDSWKEWYERYIEYFEIEDIHYNDSLNYNNQKINEIRINKIFDYKIISIYYTTLYCVTLRQTTDSIYISNKAYPFITSTESLRKTPLYSENPAYYDEEEYKFDEIIIDARFIFDGDYLTVYANKDKFKQVYFKCTENTYEQLKSLIYTNIIDLKKVTWPRHADGSCDYEKSKANIPTKTTDFAFRNDITKNKKMIVSENLKLRSGEATSTQVLAVMQAGTKVKILELGKAETIDGISSNWVKVEVQKGAKDRDGNPIKPGTVGWCFGGFLE